MDNIKRNKQKKEMPLSLSNSSSIFFVFQIYMENLNPASAMLANIIIDFMGNKNMNTETIFWSDGAGRVKEALKTYN